MGDAGSLGVLTEEPGSRRVSKLAEDTKNKGCWDVGRLEAKQARS